MVSRFNTDGGLEKNGYLAVARLHSVAIIVFIDRIFLLACSLPNCETRKWNVLGEIRVGIFAKQDIAAETELGYDYNFEWYGGAKVRCLCGATACSGFLGAKSRGFQVNFESRRSDGIIFEGRGEA